MEADVLIIGQGIAGTFLSYYLQKEGKRVVVIDDYQPDSPSRIAAGIINPVTGRRLVTVWMVDTLHPFAWKAYQEMGSVLDITAISQRSVIDFFPNPFMRESFLKKIEESDQYVHTYPEQNQFNSYFNYDFGCGEIRPAYTAHLETLLPAWRARLEADGVLQEEKFDINELTVTSDEIKYRDITAAAIIFCDGAAGFENPYFKALPWAPNKGEALTVSIPGLPSDHIFKKGMMMVPMAEKDMFWMGSAYTWDFADTKPTEIFRKNAEAVLKEWIKIPYEIVEHRSGLRPATLERRPFVGFHPLHERVGILNGMGTKGCSLAPFFAKELSDQFAYQLPITPEADVRRFSKILSKF